MNRVLLVGRITKDPELRTTQTGTSICYFTLAVPTISKNLDGSKKDPDYIPCVVWGKSAENFAKFNKKGALISVDGRINPKEFVRKDGTKSRYFEITCEVVSYLNSKQNESEYSTGDVDLKFDDSEPNDEVVY